MALRANNMRLFLQTSYSYNMR